ncbi:hypothetical protein AGABI1DRAFT_90243 [Agaricus bisporus var. burnettii JB137-S8]|uniref:CCHC-type domain-containing protein n=1 Tax=Agaricus bisporus var. burnettii (strain JB137-S8 / ATCC MYA-4627 / FGSC 10392) TaxID=597362 RepID=K5XFB1_AGABU|nr:uncharacterized protein AGABI1DRAFT_90243 [Agaricus bisporus var. burnettii JB137-S8]EKM81912.1 hypothetical protein AGABI1DRAFT_90243 [Agaricus bisporus var. burnettii JB137-S8]
MELGPSFSVKKLVKLVEKSAKARISKDDQLSEYNRNFGYLAGQLQAARKLSDLAKKEYFWKGLHPSTRKKIRAYLEIRDQTLQWSDYPNVEKVMEAGMFLFSKEADSVDNERIRVKKSGQMKKGRKSRREETSDEESSDESELSSDEESDSSESESSSEEESEEESSSEKERERKKKGKGKKLRKRQRREVKTKKVRFAEEKKMGEKGRMMEIDELTKQLHGLKVNNVAYMTTYTKLVALVPTLKDQIPLLSQWVMATSTPIAVLIARPADNRCHFCKDPGHHCRGCPVVAEYIRAGRIVATVPTGHLAYPNGSRIEWNPARMKASVDLRWGGPIATSTTGVTSLSGVRDIPPHMATAGPSSFSPYVSVNGMEGEIEERFVWGAMTELEERTGEADGLATTRAQGKEAEKKTSEGVSEEKGQATDRLTKPKPVYRFEPKLQNPEVAQSICQQILKTEVPKITVKELLTISSDLRRMMINVSATHKVPTTSAVVAQVPGLSLDFLTPLREVEVIVHGMEGKEVKEMGLLDEGSEIVLIQKDLCEELKLETANGGKEELEGCIEFLGITVEGVPTYAHAFVVKLAPYRLLLGRPWQSSVKLQKVEKSGGEVEVVVTDPRDAGRQVVVPTKERAEEKVRRGMMVLGREDLEEWGIKGKEDTLTEHILASSYAYNPSAHCLTYKSVANKICPVPGTMPDDCRIIRRFPENPLDSVPIILPYSTPFQPGKRLTEERVKDLGIFTNKSLLPEERKLIVQVLLANEMGLAWDKTEKGRFCDEYFSPVKIPVTDHVPWARKSLPIPPGIREKVMALIKQKIESGQRPDEVTVKKVLRWLECKTVSEVRGFLGMAGELDKGICGDLWTIDKVDEAVDTSIVTVRFILAQLDEEVGADKLIVEVDVKYIKGMINRPDIHPNAAMNRWIAAILMFDFKLKHVPGVNHKGLDGLSR